jgi:hypothetical protein
MDFEQYQLKPQDVPVKNQDQLQGVDNSPNIFKTAKQILSNDKITGKYLAGNYLVRGINSTGYSTVTVFDADSPGFHQVRTFIDVGNTTITINHPGQKGQDFFLKIDNDTDANRTITFGSMFKVTGTLTGSTAASAILHFISDGTAFWEVSRTTGLNQ